MLPQRVFFQRIDGHVTVSIAFLLAILTGATYFAVWTERTRLHGNVFTIALVRGAGFGAVTAAAVLVLPLLWRMLTRPILLVDSTALQIGGIRIYWQAVAEIYPCRYRGVPMVAVRTLNDAHAARRIPPLQSAIFQMRRRGIGALFAVPPVREIDTVQLVTLLRTYHHAALTSDVEFQPETLRRLTVRLPGTIG